MTDLQTMTTDRESWLTQIRSNPSDWQTMLIFADWLEESGDLLSAEQWRWIAVVQGSTPKIHWGYAEVWPMMNTPNYLADFELRWRGKHNIRCMPTYPTCLEDVERYYSSLETERALTVS